MVGYSYLVGPGFILHFVAQGNGIYPKPRSSSMRMRHRYARHIVGSKDSGLGSLRRLEAKTTERKNEQPAWCNIPTVGNAQSDPKNSVRCILSSRTLPMIVGGGNREALYRSTGWSTSWSKSCYS